MQTFAAVFAQTATWYAHVKAKTRGTQPEEELQNASSRNEIQLIWNMSNISNVFEIVHKKVWNVLENTLKGNVLLNFSSK